MRSQNHKSRSGYLVGFVLSALFWGFFSYQIVTTSNEVSSPNRTDSSSVKSGDQTLPLPSSRAERKIDLQRRLLVDSVLAIVQSYYVDADRIAHESLIDMTIERLAACSYDLKYEKEGSEVRLMHNDDVIVRADIANINYHYLLTAVLTAIEAIESLKDNNAIKLNAGSESFSAEALVMNALLSSLDAHSSLLSADDYQELRQGTEGEFGGLGILVGMRENILTVLRPLPQSPAMRAGIQQNDRIIRIDGVETYGYSLDELVEYMRGPPGSEVELILLRAGLPFPIPLNLHRERINVDSVQLTEHRLPTVNIAQIALESFSSRTSQEVYQALQQARANFSGELHGVILDMRSNPGGLLDQAVHVADIFLSEGTIVSTKGRRTEIESASKGRYEVEFPVIVLINSETASASEIVAGALQDHHRAIVVGQPSFGKGSVQTIFELPGEQALKLTVARYYTPLDRSIQNVGIQPDVWLQPVHERREARNLLGSYRYRSERYLANHLDAGHELTAEETNAGINPLSGFYLRRSTESLADDAQQDEELAIGIKIIEEVAKVYGPSLPEGARRAQHWLAMAAPRIIKRMQKRDSQVGQWLAKEHNINWQRRQNPKPDSLAVSLSQIEPRKVAVGGQLDLSWSLTNKSDHPVGRASVFVWSHSKGFETTEILVGELPPREKLSGHLTLDISPYLDAGELIIQIGVAVDGRAINGVSSSLPLELFQQQVPSMELSYALTNERGGTYDGHLEPQEVAQLTVTLTNTSSMALNHLSGHLHSFAGGQVKIAEEQFTSSKRIAPGESMQLQWELTGSRELSGQYGLFGLELSSPEMIIPHRKSISVPLMPNVQRVSNLFAH